MSNKKGLAFYRLDTDRYQDKKIKRLRKDFKRDGVAVYDYIVCEIFRVEGSFILWDESTAYEVSDYWDLKETVLSEIVNYCCAVGLFDKHLFTSERVLTSGSIQRRYGEICKVMKRTVIIPEKYAIPLEEVAKIPEETPKIPEEFAQRREEKKREEKKRPEGETRAPARNFENLKNGFENRNAGAENFNVPALQDVEKYAFEYAGIHQPGKLNAWTAEKCYLEAGNFHDNYTASGWKQANGNQIIDWQAQLRKWITKERGRTFPGAIKSQSSPGPQQKNGLSLFEKSINAHYEKYLYNPGQYTITSLDAYDFDFLEKRGLITFLEEKQAEIQKKAEGYMMGKKLKIDETAITPYIKKFAVIEFFKEQLRLGREVIFKI